MSACSVCYFLRLSLNIIPIDIFKMTFTGNEVGYCFLGLSCISFTVNRPHHGQFENHRACPGQPIVWKILTAEVFTKVRFSTCPGVLHRACLLCALGSCARSFDDGGDPYCFVVVARGVETVVVECCENGPVQVLVEFGSVETLGGTPSVVVIVVGVFCRVEVTDYHAHMYIVVVFVATYFVCVLLLLLMLLFVV